LDDYDRLVKELIFDSRARATDRLKTPEEIAQEEKQKLEALEVKNMQRTSISVVLVDFMSLLFPCC
jgi:nucleolar protein 14